MNCIGSGSSAPVKMLQWWFVSAGADAGGQPGAAATRGRQVRAAAARATLARRAAVTAHQVVRAPRLGNRGKF